MKLQESQANIEALMSDFRVTVENMAAFRHTSRFTPSQSVVNEVANCDKMLESLSQFTENRVSTKLVFGAKILEQRALRNGCLMQYYYAKALYFLTDAMRVVQLNGDLPITLGLRDRVHWLIERANAQLQYAQYAW